MARPAAARGDRRSGVPRLRADPPHGGGTPAGRRRGAARGGRGLPAGLAGGGGEPPARSAGARPSSSTSPSAWGRPPRSRSGRCGAGRAGGGVIRRGICRRDRSWRRVSPSSTVGAARAGPRPRIPYEKTCSREAKQSPGEYNRGEDAVSHGPVAPTGRERVRSAAPSPLADGRFFVAARSPPALDQASAATVAWALRAAARSVAGAPISGRKRFDRRVGRLSIRPVVRRTPRSPEGVRR